MLCSDAQVQERRQEEECGGVLLGFNALSFCCFLVCVELEAGGVEVLGEYGDWGALGDMFGT